MVDQMKSEMRKILEANNRIQQEGGGNEGGNAEGTTLKFVEEVEDQDEEVKVNGEL